MKKKNKKKKSWFKRTSRIVGMNPTTFEELWKFRITNLQFISVIMIIAGIFFGISFLLFSYTPLGRLLPEHIQNSDRQEMQKSLVKLNELDEKLALQERYIENLQKVILGEISLDSTMILDSTIQIESVNVEIDTIFSEEERELDKNLQISEERLKQRRDARFDNLFLFDPIEGEISQKFNANTHPGVDIVARKNTQIKSCLDGVVVYASYTSMDGYTVVINHENELISTYKHAQSINVKAGQKVKIGEMIGIIGDTGESSTAPHLHFELWSGSGPLNPLDYFSFGK
ncbi:MAG: M23 family metallopeptidase [Brumimicrobium sp.]